VDDRPFTYWPLFGPFVSADLNDYLHTIPGFKDLRRRFPNPDIGEVVADAGEGFDGILRFIHDNLKALRTIVTRRHTEDENLLTCLRRGYDAQGNPLCLHGYRFSFNGHGYQRGDSKWVCRQRCLHRSQPDVIPNLPSDAENNDPLPLPIACGKLVQPTSPFPAASLTLFPLYSFS